MKRTSLLLALGISGLLFFTRCGHRDSDPHALGDDFSIVPMAEYKFEPSGIKPGSPVSILAFSGGKGSKDKKLFYSQFIVVDRSTGDTTRILAAMISVDSVPGSVSERYTPADEFDGKKGVLDASFEAPGDHNQEMLNVVANMPEGEDARNLAANINDTTGQKEYVIINKNADIFLSRKYKTAKGILRFHDQPW
jgi:hypothetical protein